MHGATSGCLGVIAVLYLAGGTARAQSASACAFDPDSATLTVSVDGRIARLKAVESSGAIELNGAPCAGATLTRTDTIQVVGGSLADAVALTGDFVPGLTEEPDGASEIEISFALDGRRDEVTVHLGAGNDRQVLTSGGLDVGNDLDEDITTAGTELLVIDGGPGNDVIDATSYDGTPDRGRLDLFGGGGNDRLTGDDRPNQIFGEGGDDTLYGGSGNDDLQGGTGDDDLYGGRGNDLFISEATVDGSDLMRGGDNIDTVYYLQRTNHLEVTVGNGLADDGEPDEGDTVSADVEGVLGGSGDDLLVGSPGGDTLNGGAGVDEIRGGGGDDSVGGGDGDDRVLGEAGADIVSGGAGDDTLDGGAGPDRFYGDGGVDSVDYGSRTAPVSVTIGNWLADDGEAGEGDDLFYDIETVIGGSGNDTLVCGVFAGTLLGGGGDDELRGSDYDDVLEGGPGLDHLNGLAGADQLYGGDDDDVLEGRAGGDELFGGDGDDLLDGGGGTDSYFGEAGDDTIANLDGLAETVDCGEGAADDAEADPLDTFIGCEL